MKQVLVVEDELHLCETLKDALELKGFKVEVAMNGREGLRMASVIQPDCILSDVMMPDMDGFDMVRNLKKDKRTAYIPVIFLTARVDNESKFEGLEFGVDDYVTKPFIIQEVVLKVRNAIEIRERLIIHKLSNPDSVYTLNENELFLNKLKNCVEAHLEDVDLSVQTIASDLSMSVSGLQKKLKQVKDCSVSSFVREFRLARAMNYLQLGFTNMSDIASKTGFRSLSYFTTSFKQHYGQPPSHFKL